MWSKTKRNTHHSSKAAVIIINMYNDVKKSWATPHLFFCIFLGKWDMVQPFFSCVNIVCIILMSLKDNIWYFKLSSKNDPWLLGRPNHDRFCVCLSMYAFIPCIPYVWDVCSWSDAFLIVLHGGDLMVLVRFPIPLAEMQRSPKPLQSRCCVLQVINYR